MKHYLIILISILIAGIACISCSKGFNDPVSSDQDLENQSLPLPTTKLNTSESSRSILGTWTLRINPDTLEATVEPDRTLNAHHNVTGMIPNPLITINS